MSFKKNFSQAVDEISETAVKGSNEKYMEKLIADPGNEWSMKTLPDPVPNAVSTVTDDPVGTTVTHITGDTTINGSVSTRGSLKIEGAIIGNVDCAKDIHLRGKIEGDVSAENIEMTESEIKGNVTVKSSAVLKAKSVMKGDLHARTAEINGTVEGCVSANESVVILSNGNVTGDITTASFEVAKGAVINGKVTIDKTAREAK